MKKLLVLICLWVIILQAEAQQQAMFTHYSFNTISVNPGYAGSRGALTAVLLHRSQWINFPGAPTTQTFTLHTPLYHERIGVGLSVLNDKIGPTHQTSYYVDLAYKIPMGKGKFAFGLKGGVNSIKHEISDLTTTQANDPSFQEDYYSELLPNFGVGLYYSTVKYYVGLSTPRLLETDFTTNTAGHAGKDQRHYFFIAGAIFPLNSTGTLKLRPSTFVKVTEGVPIEFDITALVYIRDFIWAGAMYRLGDATGALVGLNITEQLSLGYSYDWSFTNSTGKYNAGSHEVILRYDFFFTEKGKIRSPRYF